MNKRILIGLTVMSIVCTVSVLITGCAGNTPTVKDSTGNTSTMKGSTYVNGNPENKPMFFMTETVGVLEFVDDNQVAVLFPYAIDTKNIASVSSELWISGEYKRIGNTITISFKLGKKQKEPGTLKVKVYDEGKTLLGENGERFTKVVMEPKKKK